MVRKQLTLTGVVQGVGFRPNVARVAARHRVTGLCGNDDNSVFIEAQGEPDEVDAFFEDVRTDLPPLASIIAWREFDLVTEPDEADFRIVPSRRGVGAITLIPADAAVCPDCLADMADPANRRYNYPFTTCTNCGPRLSIIRDVPYDRPLTTMAEFEMCDACRQEYTDPADRRFHAQPISCFDCGPDLWLEYSSHATEPQSPLTAQSPAIPPPPSAIPGPPSAVLPSSPVILPKAGSPTPAPHVLSDPSVPRLNLSVIPPEQSVVVPEPSVVASEPPVVAESLDALPNPPVILPTSPAIPPPPSAIPGPPSAVLPSSSSVVLPSSSVVLPSSPVILPKAGSPTAVPHGLSDPPVIAAPPATPEVGSPLTPEPTQPPAHPDSPGAEDRRTRFARTIQEARNLLAQGKILAVKGIGGFTLMCDARNPRAVAELRERKRRPGKPLAVMAGSLEAAQSIADLRDEHIRALTSREAPIVLAPMAPTYDLADEVAPGLDDVGVMLAYAPLHRLLLGPGDIVVATSANSSAKPLTYRNEDARADLSGIVDAFLMHNRGIHVPVEDSVVMTDGDQTSPIRRSRGYAPLPVFLGPGTDNTTDRCVLAVGAELKNTFALTRDSMAFLSAHVGDMGSLETQRAFEKSVEQMLTAHRRTPELVVVDKHPGYATHAWGIRYAERLGVPLLEVQHHHAHALSLMAENLHADPPTTYIVLDGTGYGDDGTIWGGEILTLGVSPLDYERAWHLPGFWLPGGDSAVRHPWKSAAGLAWEYGIDLSGLPGYAPLGTALSLPGTPPLDHVPGRESGSGVPAGRESASGVPAGRESGSGVLAGRESGSGSVKYPDSRPGGLVAGRKAGSESIQFPGSRPAGLMAGSAPDSGALAEGQLTVGHLAEGQLTVGQLTVGQLAEGGKPTPGGNVATGNPLGIDEWALVQSQLENRVGVVRTTSTGRLFDAASSILGICHTVTYEAQAAMELESAARRCTHGHETPDNLSDLVNTLVEGVRDHRPVPCLARIFHTCLARVIAQGLYSVHNEPTVIGLTGGVLANRLLTSELVRDLTALGHRVVRHQIVPANDGGLALGQALAGVLLNER